MTSDVLIVDDEADIRELVSGILEDEGYATRVASSAEEALQEIRNRVPSLLLLDVWLIGSSVDGIELLKKIKAEHPDLPVIIISGHGTIETAVTAIKMGAYDFVEKPFKADRIILVVERALETRHLRRENQDLRVRVGGEDELVGQAPSMTQLRQTIERVSPTNSRVLITGPSGSGKELVARQIHRKSRRAAGRLVAINAATMSPKLMEIELFGVEGTDEQSHKVGALEQAHGGTLYIDEVADMPLETQGKILRVLVEQTFRRVGGGPLVEVDVRVMSSTSRQLREEIDQGRFRQDLFHRLSVVPVKVPSLAERREDIPLLVEYFLDRLVTTAGLPRRDIGDDTMAALQAHNWPGNVRELRNTVERLLILSSEEGEGVISADLLPTEVGSSTPSVTNGAGSENIISLPLREAREVFERQYLIAQINRFGGNISRTATFIGMERSALHRKLKSLGIVNPTGRSGGEE
ncbi:MAG: sigma-54-dependent transcriptional regulator [Alphaproteobacteria bacterium]